MKKTLSLILAVMMLLGTLSITAFAAPPPDMLSVGGKQIVSAAELRSGVTDESGKLIGIDAITAGTVTYTAPEDNGGIYKLTLNNATIAPEMHKAVISAMYAPLEIELIGVNTVSATGVYSPIQLFFSDTVFSGTGSLIVHGSDNQKCPTIGADNSTVTLPLGYTAVGSTSKTETNVENMTKVSLDEVADKVYTYYVGETAAQTVVIYNPYFDSTDITLKVAKELSYEMVIPEDVTNLNNFGVFEVGQAKVKDVKNATENTMIFCTAETTDFKCEGKSDIPASYYTDAEGSTAFPTTAVTVYEDKADAEDIPTMYVGVSETDWDDAENGTYKATVTFNFEAKTFNSVADILATVEGEFPTTKETGWIFDGGETAAYCYVNDGNLTVNYDSIDQDSISLKTNVEKTDKSTFYYIIESNDLEPEREFTFRLTGGVLTEIDYCILGDNREREFRPQAD